MTPALNHPEDSHETPPFQWSEKMKPSSTSLEWMWWKEALSIPFLRNWSCHWVIKKKPFEYNTYLTGYSLGGVKIINGGRGYTVPPTAEVQDSYGQDVELEVILGNGATSPDDDDGSIQTYAVQQTNVSAPALPCIRSDGKVQSGGSSFLDPDAWSSV